MRGYSADKHWRDVLPRLSFLEPLLDEKDVLEIGCGDGTSAALIKEKWANSVIGLEKPGLQLEKALSKQNDSLRFDHYVSNRLDFADASFDIVIAFEIDQQLSLLPEIKRILKEDGFLITSWNHPEYRNTAEWFLPPAKAQRPALEKLQQELEKYFPHLTQIDQTPFYGFSFAPTAAVEAQDERPLEMDSDLFLNQTETPAATLLLCGQATLEFDYHSLVQMPFAPLQETLLGSHQKQLDEQKRSHHSEIDKLRQQNETLRANRENSDQSRKQDAQEISRLEKTCAQLEEKLSEAKSLCEHLQTRLNKETSEHEQLQASGQLLESRLAENRESLAQAKQTISTQQGQLEEKESWISALRSETEQLEESLRERDRQIEEYQKQIGVLKREQQMLEQKRSTSQKQLQTIKQELILQKQQKERSEKNAQNAKHTIDELESQLEQERNIQLFLTQEKSVLQGQNQSLADQLSNQESLLTEANQNLEQLGSKLEAVTAEYAALHQKHLILTAKRETADEQIAILLNEKKNLIQETNSLQTQLEKYKTTSKDLKSQLDAQNKQRFELEKRLQDQEQLCQDLQNDLVDMVNQLQNEKSREHERQQTLHQHQENLSQKDQQLADLHEKIEELTHELFDSRRNEEQRSATLEKLREQLAEEQKTKEQLTSEIKHLRLGENESIRDLEHKCSRLEHSRKNAKKRIADLELSLQLADRTAKHMQSEAKHVRLELEKTQGHLAEVLDRLRTTDQIRQKASELERELTWISADKDRLQAQNQQLEQTLKEVKDQLARKHQTLDANTEKNERLTEDLQEARIIERKLKKLLGDSHKQNKADQIQIQKGMQQSELAQKTQSQLEQQLQQSEQALKDKKQQLQQSEQALKDKKQQLQQSEQALKDKAQQLQQAQTQLDELGQINTKREQDLRQLQQQLGQEIGHQSAQEEQAQQDNLENIKIQIDQLKQKTGLELTSLAGQIRRKDEQLASMTEQLAEINQQRLWWENRASDIEQELKHEREQYQKQITQQEQETLERLTWKLSQEQSTNKRREKEIQELNQHVRELVQRRQAMEDLANKLRTRLEDLEHKQNAAAFETQKAQIKDQECINQQAAIVADLQEKQARNEDKILELKERLEEEQDHAQKLEMQCHLLKTQQHSQSTSGSDRPADLARISAEMKGAKRRIAELESELMQARTQHQKALQQVRQAQTARDALQTKLQERQQLIEKLTQQIQEPSDQANTNPA